MTITLSPTIQQTRDALCCAFEGGSNYWYTIADQHLSHGLTNRDFTIGGIHNPRDNYFHPCEIIPTVDTCALLIRDVFRDHTIGVWLNHLALDYAFDALPLNTAMRITSDESDAIDGDMWLQLAVYGELVYG